MLIRNLKIAIDSILANKLRAILTTLGIIFGVAAVIAMLAIGNGAQQKIIEQLKIVGANNVFIQADFSDEQENTDDNTTKSFSPGLTLLDLNNIKDIVPGMKYISPEVISNIYANSSTRREKSMLIGVTTDYFKLFNLELANGNFFSENHNQHYKNVCILGNRISKKLFPNSSPIGKTIRVKQLNLTVIGVLKNSGTIDNNLQGMGVNDHNEGIYTPIKTYLTRFENRSKVKIAEEYYWDDENETPKKSNLNQLDKILIQFTESNSIYSGVTLINKILYRRHNSTKDYSIIIPEQLLKQQKETDDLFNLLLGAIASISLIVGGIGIMNIMLASVMERIREIGLRMAIGAQKNDIKYQFVLEALLISLSGGIIGVFLGIGLSYLIENLLLMPVKISLFSVVISFFISVLVGVIFGYLPAKRAAEQNPVTSLRYE